MERDISKNMVMVLIVISLIVSIIGTWMLSERLDIDNTETEEIRGNKQGNVGFEILEKESKTGISGGNVGFNKIN